MVGQTQGHSQETIDLKDPALAAFLGWLVPGLGHLYQGRTAKGILFLVCILGTFVYGVYLGGNSEVGWGRVVYMSFHPEDQRLHFLCQAGVGLAAMPAVIQAFWLRRGEQAQNPGQKPREPLWGSFMAPPRLPSDRSSNRPTLDDLHKKLHHYFELGTLYTMIAGLLNILAIYDAWAGPVREEEAEAENRPSEEGVVSKASPEAGSEPPESRAFGSGEPRGIDPTPS
ncbi:MAG: hypothetical protein NZ602_01140 [Thermoguttaceae bacterium]|nr:hypothetical protein [Thermoguttaceae bacterium]